MAHINYTSDHELHGVWSEGNTFLCGHLISFELFSRRCRKYPRSCDRRCYAYEGLSQTNIDLKYFYDWFFPLIWFTFAGSSNRCVVFGAFIQHYTVTWGNPCSEKFGLFRRMSTQRNLCIYRALFLTAVVVIVCDAVINEMKFTKNLQYSNLLPTNTSIFLSEAGVFRLSECAGQCSIFQYACAGIFYNKFLESCKPLRSGQSGVSAYVNRTGWNFWGTCKYYNDVSLGVIGFSLS